jgi:hypothetical protein
MGTKRNIRVALPAFRIRLEAVDTMFENLDAFGRLVVMATVREPLAETDLVEATGLAPDHVQALLDDLIKGQLVEREVVNGAAVILPGRLGADAIQRTEQISRFNAANRRFYLERLSGTALLQAVPFATEQPEDALVLPAQHITLERDETYIAAVPERFAAELPADGIAYRLVEAEEGFICSYLFRDQLLRLAMQGLERQTGRQREKPAEQAAAAPRKVIHIPLTGKVAPPAPAAQVAVSSSPPPPAGSTPPFSCPDQALEPTYRSRSSKMMVWGSLLPAMVVSRALSLQTQQTDVPSKGGA